MSPRDYLLDLLQRQKDLYASQIEREKARIQEGGLGRMSRKVSEDAIEWSEEYVGELDKLLATLKDAPAARRRLRLLAHLLHIGLSDRQYDLLSDEMKLDSTEINAVLSSAQAEWDRVKAK